MKREKTMGMADIAAYTGIKPNTLAQMDQRGQMPPPDDHIGLGRWRVWYPSTIDTWMKDRQR